MSFQYEFSQKMKIGHIKYVLSLHALYPIDNNKAVLTL